MPASPQRNDAPAAPPAAPLRVLSFDVEEYFHIEAAHAAVPRTDWDRWPSRVEASVDLLLGICDRQGLRATFFVLGDVARRCPRLVPRIAAGGHEIASHGNLHDRLHRLDPAAFAGDLDVSRKLLEDQSGQPVRGYRAPTFSVVPATAWAIDVLLDAGFAYDSSIFPVRHPAYGVPAAPDRPFLVNRAPGSRTLLEIPPLTLALPTLGASSKRRHLGVAGGGYFRLLPEMLMTRGLAQAAQQGRPAVLYFHPWEFDPGIPRMPLPLLGRVRTYTGLESAAARLEKLIARHRDARWAPMAELLPELTRQARARPVFHLQAEAPIATVHAAGEPTQA
ncbi:MAG: DUF3473 domain-containing protein [Planctomycetota bacterium]|nr:DUF3473 domain-containing protein [Planctomycetota bacterium]